MFLIYSLIQTPPNTLLHQTAQIQVVPQVPTLLIGISLRWMDWTSRPVTRNAATTAVLSPTAPRPPTAGQSLSDASAKTDTDSLVLYKNNYISRL